MYFICLHVMQSILIGSTQSQISFFPSFSITFQRSLFVVYNFVSSRSSPFSASHFTTSNLKVLMNNFTYSDPFSFFKQAGGGAMFLYTIRITCICHMPLIHRSFSMFLFLSLAPVMQILVMFSWDTFQPSEVLHYCIKKKTLTVSAKSN